MAEFSYSIKRAIWSLRLAVRHARRALYFLFRALVLIPLSYLASGMAMTRMLPDAEVRRHHRHAIVRKILRPIVFVTVAIAMAVLGVVGLVIYVAYLAFLLWGLFVLVTFFLYIFAPAFFWLQDVDEALRNIPPSEVTGFWLDILPFAQSFGVFAILVPFVAVLVALALAGWIFWRILKLLIALPGSIARAVKRLRGAIARSVRAAGRRAFDALLSMTWRQALLLALFLSAASSLAWASLECAQVQACRQAAPWAVTGITFALLIAFIGLERSEGRGWSVKLGGAPVLATGPDGLTLFGLAILQKVRRAYAVISVAIIQFSRVSISLLGFGLVSIFLVSLIAFVIEDRSEAPEPRVDPPLPPTTSSTLATHKDNVFKSFVYWRSGSALELRDRRGREIDLEDVRLDRDALCSHAFVVVVGAASPDGSEFVNAQFARQRALSTGLVLRNLTGRCPSKPSIVATSLTESIAGLPAIEGRRLLAFGVDGTSETDIDANRLDGMIAIVLQKVTEASVDEAKLRPEHCLYYRGAGKNAFALQDCRERWPSTPTPTLP